MTDYFAKKPKPYDYAAFIDELREHLVAATSIPLRERIWHSETFKSWKLAVDDSIRKARRKNFPVDTSADGRSFRIFDSDWAVASTEDQMHAFDGEMQDTIAEFRLIIKNFERYGGPVEAAAAPTDAQWAALTAERDGWKERALKQEAVAPTRSLFRRWWEGRHIPPPPDDPSSPVLFLSLGHYERHWTARVVSWSLEFWRRHKLATTLVGAIVAGGTKVLIEHLW